MIVLGGPLFPPDAADNAEAAGLARAAPADRFCTQCGSRTPPASRFCSECGTSLSDEVTRAASG